MNNYTIQTKDETRARLWRYLFGVDALPVLSNRARWQYLNGRMTYAYDLDLRRLTDQQRARFAAHVAKKTGRNYSADVLPEIATRAGYPIDAQGCRVVVLDEIGDETAVQDRRPFFITLYDLFIYHCANRWHALRTRRAANRHLSPG